MSSHEFLQKTRRTKEEYDPLPNTVEGLVSWIDSHFPEETPRYSDRDTVDACLRRSGIRELVALLRKRLEEEHERALEGLSSE